MYTYDSTFEELDALIAQVVGYVPKVPKINYNQMSMYWLKLSNNYEPWEQTPYDKIYLEIIGKYFAVNNSVPMEGCEETFGFNNRELKHPLLNALMLDMQRMHYKYMAPIIKKVKKEVAREERKRGHKYSEIEYWNAVRDRAIQARRVEIGLNTKRSFDAMEARSRAYVSASLESDRRREEEERRANLSPGERAVEFAMRHPFLTGLIGGMIYQRIKRSFTER